MSDKDLMVKNNNNFVIPVMDSSVAKAMDEEMDGLPRSFTRVKIPSGGSTIFEIPADDADGPEMAKEVIGVIVDHHPINAYWPDKYAGGNNPPDCSSIDGKFGTGNPGGSCKNCPYNQFGSAADGIGKACKNMHRIYILRSGEMLPLLLTLPPTSLKPFGDYVLKRIITKGYRTHEVITKITLKKVQNSAGISYSQAQFSMVAPLNTEEKEFMRKFSESIKAVTRQIAIDEYEEDAPPPQNGEEMPF